LGAAHDLSVGGLAVALARMAIAARKGAAVELPEQARFVPTAALYGERTGRVLVTVAADGAAELAAACAEAGVAALRLGSAGGNELRISWSGGGISASVDRLAGAWETPL
jgi:phosphoribosylformylglycinamidine (FGAM) synthase-like enzyme